MWSGRHRQTPHRPLCSAVPVQDRINTPLQKRSKKISALHLKSSSASLRYFSLGEVTTDSTGGSAGQTLNPYEMSIDVGYSRKLSEKFSMGIVFRYIYSDLGFGYDSDASQSTGASAFAADIAGYFTSYPIIGRNECQWLGMEHFKYWSGEEDREVEGRISER